MGFLDVLKKVMIEVDYLLKTVVFLNRLVIFVII
jgi:hypothetical protein